MQYFLWLIKRITLYLCVSCILFYHADSRRYDKCETPDGRQGVCVVKRYCREATVQQLEACDNDDNLCCPISPSHRSAQPPVFPVSEPHNNRNGTTSNSDHNMSQDSDRRSLTRDFHNENQKTVYSHANPKEDVLSNLPNSDTVPSASHQDSRKQIYPDESSFTKNDDIPKRQSQDSDHRSVASDFNTNNRRPVNDHTISSKTPVQSHKVLSSSKQNGRQPVTSQHNPEESFNDDYDLPKSSESQNSDHRSSVHDINNDNQRPVYNSASPGSDSSTNIPSDSHKMLSSSNGASRRHNDPVEDIQSGKEDNIKRTLNSGYSVNHSDTPISGGRVRFEDAEHLFNDRNRRLKPQYSNSNVRPSAESSEIDSFDRQNSAGPDSAESNRNINPKPQSSNVGHYPSRHQLDVQKLPSNPRRLKPLRSNERNDTFDEVVRHTFYPNTQPKVPACDVKPYDLFIAGGETSEAHEWPWMTSIFRRHQGSRPKTFQCGGSLINTKYVLTAAHCFVNNYVVLPASSFVIRLGSHFLDSGEEYTVSDLVIHHNHSGSDFFNDIALVKIASVVYITDKIAPICLPTPDMMSHDFIDRMATVAGWGDTAFRTGGSRALQHVTIPIVSGEECFAAYSRVRGAAFLARGSDHVICAGLREGGKDACLGDSGGPLMLKTVDDRWIIVGIVSLGYKCAEPGYPGVYTRVTHYLTWIYENMKPH